MNFKPRKDVSIEKREFNQKNDYLIVTQRIDSIHKKEINQGQYSCRSRKQLYQMFNKKYPDGEEILDELKNNQYFRFAGQAVAKRRERMQVSVKLPRIQTISSNDQYNFDERAFYFSQSEEKKQSFKDLRLVEQNVIKYLNPKYDDNIETNRQVKEDIDKAKQDLILATSHLKLLPAEIQKSFQKPNNFEDSSFYSIYKQVDKQTSYEDEFNLELSLQSRILREGQVQGVLPKQNNMLGRNRQKQNVFKGNNLSFGDKQGAVFAFAIQSEEYKYMKHIDLSNNRLSQGGIKPILQNLPQTLTSIDLSRNDIGIQGVMNIQNLLQHNIINLKSLNLSYCNLHEQGGRLLFTLLKSSSLQVLDISGNNIGDGCYLEIKKFMRQNQTLNELYTRYNSFRDLAGKALFKGFLHNGSIKVLDLAHNGLGGGGGQVTDVICQSLLSRSCEVTHMDLSFNHFSQQEVAKIQKALISNNSLFGLHFEGNGPYFVNHMGFLDRLPIEQEKQEIDNSISAVTGKLKGANFLSNIPNPYKLSIENRDICWICEGWTQVKFIWNIFASSEIKHEPLFLHLSFESWKPVMMEKKIILKQQTAQNNRNNLGLTKANDAELEVQETEEYFQVFRMCPPNLKIFYFFSNPVLHIQTYADDQDKVDASEYKSNSNLIYFQDGSQQQKKNLAYYNTLQTTQSLVIDDLEEYQPIINIYPRQNERHYLLNKFQIVKRRKNINQRIPQFMMINQSRSYNLRQAFEIDFNLSRLPKTIRQEYDKINSSFKDCLFKYHNGFRELFRLISSCNYQVIQNQFNYFVPFKILNKLIQGLGLIDEDRFKQSDLDLDLLSLKNNPDLKLTFNPDKGVLRFQFIEIFVRIAQDKYIRNSQAKSMTEAVEKLLTESVVLKKLLISFDNPQQWREVRLYNKECQMFFFLKLNYLKDLFEYVTNFSKKKWLSKVRWVTYWDVLKLFRKVNLITEYFTERDLNLLVSMTDDFVYDDYGNEKSGQMYFAEFLELIGRVADHLSPASLGESYRNTMYEARAVLPLHVKLETTVTYLFQTAKLPKDLDHYSLLFATDVNSIFSMPVSQSNLSKRSSYNPIPIDQQKSQHSWQLQQMVDDICQNLQPLTEQLPVQSILSYLKYYQEDYVPDSFWYLFREKDQSYQFENEDSQQFENQESQYSENCSVKNEEQDEYQTTKNPEKVCTQNELVDVDGYFS